MRNNSAILIELQEIAPSLVQCQNKQPYAVSDSYFDGVSEDVMKRVGSGAGVGWQSAKGNPYSTPANYFETLGGMIVQRVKNEEATKEVFAELEEISPILNTINKKSVYSVPADYFENTGWNKSWMSLEEGKVVSINRVGKTFRYLVAAVIIGLLSVGIFLFSGKQNGYGFTTEKPAAAVKTLSEQEIIDFLKTTSPTDNIVSNGNNNTRESDIKNSLRQMTDKEIQEFLRENGEQDEM